jgi:hypothetical protein
MQFSQRDERISSTLVGFSRPERVDETIRLASRDAGEGGAGRAECPDPALGSGV